MSDPASSPSPQSWVSPLATFPGAVLSSEESGDEAGAASSDQRAFSSGASVESVAGASSGPGSASSGPGSAPAAGPAVRPAPTIPVALHYADPSGEQWALEAGRGLVDRADLGVVAVSGVDRQTWLTSITTQIVTGMGPGDSRELLVLDPQGRIEHAAAVSDDGTTTWLICEGHDAAPLADFLDSMRFALRVEVEIRSDLTVFATAGSLLDTAEGLPGWVLTWSDPWPGVAEGGAEYFQGRHPGATASMRLHLVSRESAPAFVSAWLAADAKRRPAGLLAWEAVRIAAWRPRLGWETDARSIPAELDWLRTAVHTHKGCYRGQESIARVLNLGRPPRRLVFLQLDGSRGDLPEPGTRISLKGRVVGVVTSVARHAELGPIALALLGRSAPADTTFDLDGIAAAQELIVPVDGKSSISPKERPGADLVNPELRRHDVSPLGGLGALGAR
nr:folate-binding protein [Actinomyces culturomici]